MYKCSTTTLFKKFYLYIFWFGVPTVNWLWSLSLPPPLSLSVGSSCSHLPMNRLRRDGQGGRSWCSCSGIYRDVRRRQQSRCAPRSLRQEDGQTAGWREGGGVWWPRKTPFWKTSSAGPTVRSTIRFSLDIVLYLSRSPSHTRAHRHQRESASSQCRFGSLLLFAQLCPALMSGLLP